MLSNTVVFAIVLLCLTAFAHAVTVDTTYGRIEGYSTPDGDIFRGIPFAQAPIGRLRWNATQPITTKFNLFRAFEDGAACPQVCELPAHTCPERQSEDCLFLNIFTPSGTVSSSQKLPVMVYFHGGNYKAGYGGGPLYNGTTIAKAGEVIVVSINYRLGALGYLANPAIGFQGNYGHLDQLMSLHWVKENLAAFGGDINNVTIFGQSAGAGSVAAHLISPFSQGLFHRALLQSNPFAIPFRDVNSVVSIANTFAKHAGCEPRDQACFMKLTPEAIIEAQNKAERDQDSFSGGLLAAFIPWTPLVEGKIIPYQPIDAFRLGAFINVPTIIGTTLDESLIFIYQAFQQPLSAFSYAVTTDMIFGLDKGAQILQRYPAYSEAELDNRDKLVVIGTEFIFHCANRNATRDLLAVGHTKSNVYLYQYDHAMSFGKEGWGPKYPECYDKACHAAELPMVWNSAHWLFDYTQEEISMANNIGTYWTNFAWTGNPNIGRHGSASTSTSTSKTLSMAFSDDIKAAMNGIDLLPDADDDFSDDFSDDVSDDLSLCTTRASPIPIWAPYFQAQGTLRIQVVSNGGIRMENDMDRETCTFWDSIGYSNQA